MIAPTPFFADRGCHVRIYEEARVLQSLGNRVRIYTYHNGRDTPGIEIKRIMNIPWYKKLEAGPSWHMLYLDTLLLLRILRDGICEKPDIIHAHLHEGALLGSIYKKFKRVPLIFDCQGSLTEELVDHNFLKKGSLFFKFIRRVEKIICNFADAIVVSSTNSANFFKEEFEFRESKIFLVSDSVDGGKFKVSNCINLKKELKLPLDKKIVVYLGLLNKYQGIDYLLEVIHYIVKVKKNRRVHFFIMGYPAVEKYKKIALSKGISDNITFTGRIDYEKVSQYLSLGDIAVSLKISKTESNGKLYNYMAMGLPTVVFDTPVNREILGEGGIYVKLNDYLSFAEKIEHLLQNKELRKTLGEKLRERVVNNYSWEKAGKRIMEVYEEVLERKNKENKV